MKPAIRKIIFAFYIGFLFLPLLGQNIKEAYRKAIDDIFSGIPAEKVTTGILIERAPSIVNMARYESINRDEIDTCNVRRWKQMYLQLDMAHLDSRKFNYDSRIAETDFQKTSNPNDIPLGIIFYDYNRIDPYAQYNKLLSIDAHRGTIRDISGARGTPLKTVTCFAASPMKEILQPGTYSFYIDPKLFISNKTKSFDEITIDFGDGKGFVLLPATGKVRATFETQGVHTLTLKAVHDHKTYISYSSIYILQPKLSLRASGTDPERTPDEFNKNYDKANIIAEYGIWYRCNHDHTLHKPFLIVSGFDPGNEIRIQEEPNDSDKDKKLYLYHAANKDGFLDRLRENGYDIIAYRSTESGKSVIANAMNLVELIKKINNEKTSNNELVIAGASMGGLVSRYALTWMEHNNIDHQTRLFVSIDSPQNGANIPLGMQHLLSSLSNQLNGIVTIVSMLQDAVDTQLDSPAAKEMLLYHHTATSGTTAACAPERTAYLSNLAAIGNFPQKCKSLAVSMGSGIGLGQGFAAGQSLLKKSPSNIGDGLFQISASTVLLLEGISGGLIPPGTSALLSGSNLTWEFEASAVPNQTLQTIYNEDIKLQPCIEIFNPLQFAWEAVCLDLATLYHTDVKVNNTVSIDNAPGAKKNIHNLTAILKNEWLIDILAFFGTMTAEPHNDCFIPAYSALGLSVDPHTHIKNYLGSQPDVKKINNNDRFYRNYNKTDVSPFDYLYIEEPNMEHIANPDKSSALTSAMISIMEEEFLTPTQLILENITVHSGDEVAYEAGNIAIGGNFTVESGGNVEIRGGQITLNPGFHAQAGATVTIKADVSWICPAGSIQSVSLSPLSLLSYEEDIEMVKTAKGQPAHPAVQTMENEVRVFPNPVENRLSIQILNKIDGEIKIMFINMNGQIVYSTSIINNMNNTIDCSQFGKGTYLVKIDFKDGTKTFKIIKK